MYESDELEKMRRHVNLMNGIKKIVEQERQVEVQLQEVQKRNSIKGRWSLLLGRQQEIRKQIEPKIKSNYFSKERIAVYTCIIGNYDILTEPLYVPDNCDFYVITDQDIPVDSSWKKINSMKYISNYLHEDERNDPILISRLFKIMPFEFFSNYKYSIYIDANFQIYTDLTEFIYRIDSKYGMGFFMHQARQCVYDEIEQCIKLGKDSKEKLTHCIKYLNDNGMPKNYGLLAGGIIVRDNRSKRMISVMREWWKEYKKLSRRDQISLPYVLYKNNILPSDIGTLGGNYKEELAFKRILHKKVN